MARRPPSDLALVQRLRAAGLQPTRQRLAVAAVILSQPVHLTADQVLKALHIHAQSAPAAIDIEASETTRISRATVYATLAQFTQAGLLRALHSDGAVVYDSHPTLHPHWLDLNSGQVHDLPPGVALRVEGLESLPAGWQLQDTCSSCCACAPRRPEGAVGTAPGKIAAWPFPSISSRSSWRAPTSPRSSAATCS